MLTDSPGLMVALIVCLAACAVAACVCVALIEMRGAALARTISEVRSELMPRIQQTRGWVPRLSLKAFTLKNTMQSMGERVQPKVDSVKGDLQRSVLVWKSAPESLHLTRTGGNQS
jgi:hypothetical protein